MYKDKTCKLCEKFFSSSFANEQYCSACKESEVDCACGCGEKIKQFTMCECNGNRGENPQERIDLFKQYGYDTLVVWEKELDDLNVLGSKLSQFASS